MKKVSGLIFSLGPPVIMFPRLLPISIFKLKSSMKKFIFIKKIYSPITITLFAACNHKRDLNEFHDPRATKNQSTSIIKKGLTIAISFVPVINTASAKKSPVAPHLSIWFCVYDRTSNNSVIDNVKSAASPSSCP